VIEAMNEPGQGAAGSDGGQGGAVPETPQPPAGEPATSRAGRNLPVAAAVGVGLGALAIASLVFAKGLFAVLGAVVVFLGVGELSDALKERRVMVARLPILLSVPVVAYVAYEYGPVAHLTSFATLVLVILLFRLTRGVERFVPDAAGSVFVAAYLPLMLGFAILTLRAEDGAWLVATFVLLTVGSDIGGYAAGVLFGKHPMFPSISPKKSWEGFAGSVLTQTILGALLFVYALDSDWWKGVIVGLVMTVTATLGDFIESALKRDLGIKDMGTLVPGHGGVMDRLDSLIPNAFVSWALFTLLLGI
jgi:phosphatidate cytidylyltransferase